MANRLLQYSCMESSMDRGVYSPWGHKWSDRTEQLTFHLETECKCIHILATSHPATLHQPSISASDALRKKVMKGGTKISLASKKIENIRHVI